MGTTQTVGKCRLLADALGAWSREPRLQWRWARRSRAVAATDAWLTAAADPAAVHQGSLRVVQYIGALTPGGAERQLTNLAIALQRRGHHSRVLTTYPLADTGNHYLPRLDAAGVPAACAGLRARSLAGCRRRPSDLLPADLGALRQHIDALVRDLLRDPPDVLHCWLDEASIIGGIAGLLAGVPRVMLGLRIPNPSHYPRFIRPYMLPWYRRLRHAPRVGWVANSASAAASYAEWIGMPAARIHVVPNGLCPRDFPAPTPAARATARLALGLGPAERVVAGVFRLFEEKRPHLFLDLVRRAAVGRPDLRVLHAGVGPLEAEFQQAIAASGLADRIRAVGRCADVGQLLLAADVLLAPSVLESMPNGVMEAQFLGVPVVAVRAGATAESVVEGETALLADPDDGARLLSHLTAVLDDHERRHRMAAAARAFALRAFDLDAMAERTLASYRASA